MTLRATVLCAVALLAAAAPQDEMTVERLIDRMEGAAAEIRGAAYSLPSVDRLLLTGTIEADRKGRVRVRFPIAGFTTSHPQYPDRQLILADGNVFFLNEFEFNYSSKLGFIPYWAERLAAANCDRLDPSFLPTIEWPAGVGNSEHAFAIFFFLFSPRQALAFERDLRIVGKRTVDGEECWVLRAEKALSRPFDAQVKKFFVRTRDYKLHAVRMTSCFPKSADPPQSSWTVRYGKDSAPIRIELKHKHFTRGWNATWDLAAARRPAEPESIAVPDDLHATHFRFDDLAERLKKFPDDPELLASLALTTGRTQDLERAVEKRPGMAPTINLIRRYQRDQAKPALLNLVRGIQSDRAKAPEAVLVEAARAAGDPDLALALLDGRDSDAIRLARALAWAGKDDMTKAVAELVPLMVRTERPVDPTWVFPLNRSKPNNEGALKPLRDAAAAHPSAPGPRLVFFWETLRLKKYGDLPGAVRDFLAVKPSDDQVRLFSTMFLNSFIFPMSKAEDDALESMRSCARELLAALDNPTLAESSIRHLRFLLFDQLKDWKGADAEISRLMDVLEKEDRAKRSLAFDLIKADVKTGPLFERARALYFDSLKAPWPLALQQQPVGLMEHPLYEYAQARMKAGEYLELLRTIRGIDLNLPLEKYGGNVYILLQAKQPDHSRLGTEALALAEGETKEEGAALLVWTGKLLERSAWTFQPRFHLAETKLAYVKALELTPDSGPALEGLIRIAIHDRDYDAAQKWAREAISRRAKGAAWPETRLRVVLAHALAESNDLKGARAELERIELPKMEIEARDAWKAADLWEKAGDAGRAIEFVERLVEDGRRPFVRLAEMYAKAGRPGESLRMIDRAVAQGFDSYYEDPEFLFIADAMRPASHPAIDPVKIREALIEGECGDLAIREFLARPLQPMTDDETRRTRAAFERMGSEHIAEREKAMKELSDVGPRGAAIVKEGLASGDAEVKRRSRTLLLKWVLAK